MQADLDTRPRFAGQRREYREAELFRMTPYPFSSLGVGEDLDESLTERLRRD